MDWKGKLKNNIRTIDQLKEYLDLTASEEDAIRGVKAIHPMNITQYYISLIDRENRNDPIRKLVIPSEHELCAIGDYDTSGEQQNTITEGLQHKYDQTALILATNRCAAYCRFCFRKRLVGLPNKEVLNRFSNAAAYIKQHKEVNNVLISGGDPFVLPTKIINYFLEKLSGIKHIRFIRFGTRVPVVFPDRILDDKKLLKILKRYSTPDKRIYVVTHFNHPKEITPESKDALDRLIQSNVILNNQTVLLNGVNDNSRVLAKLLNKLSGIGVNPYYVFQCRPVKRVKNHFQVPIYRGCKIITKTKKYLNGHSKRFKYVMSHETGKVEILGIKEDQIYFRYHQARNQDDVGKMFSRKIDKRAGWIDDFKS